MFHVKQDQIDDYVALLKRWDRSVRLVGASLKDGLSADDLHDSRILASHLGDTDRLADIGTGNGLPIIPALLIADYIPSQITLVESDSRKAAFLKAVRRQLGLNYDVLSSRIESIPYLEADTITAKALAPLPRLLELCASHLAPHGRILAFKGRQAEVEIADAARTWDFEIEREGRNARTGAVLLVIRNPQRRTSA